jgi:hypothetical protein
VRDQAHYEQDQKDEKANLGYLGGGKGYPSEAQKTRNQCDHQENQRVMQHRKLLSGTAPWFIADSGPSLQAP